MDNHLSDSKSFDSNQNTSGGDGPPPHNWLSDDASELAKILIVDDNPTNLQVLSDSIKGQGNWRLLFATDGESAIKQVQYAQPDLILLDIMMPGIDGFETCRWLKNDALAQNIPIIFMTALADTSHKIKGLELGAVDYITKPFQKEEVMARICLHLRLSSLSQELEQKNMVLSQEISEKNRAESQLRSLNQELEQRVEERTSELFNSYQQLKRTQLQLVQHEKMATLGNMMAGIAHEINNPIGFLNGSITSTKDYQEKLFEYIQVCRRHYPQEIAQVKEYEDKIDLSFIQYDFPKLLESMENATDRITTISNSIRIFSRSDTHKKIKADIHEGLDSTLIMLKYRIKANEYRPAIQVIKKYGELPMVDCFPGQLNQVLMNILANAIDMFDEMAQQTSFDDLETNPQNITLQTTISPDQQTVVISIRDNGKGMSTEVISRVFDHLFTTKEVGKGTGLGLAIAHQIITEEHDGQIDVHSQEGKGTEFFIHLPT